MFIFGNGNWEWYFIGNVTIPMFGNVPGKYCHIVFKFPI